MSRRCRSRSRTSWPERRRTAKVGPVAAGVTTKTQRRRGLFARLDRAPSTKKTTDSENPPQSQSWKTINAQALVTGRVTRQGDGRLKAEFRLWDVASGQQ